MQKRPVIFFDWDGTLADSMDLCVQEVATALRRMGLPPVSEELMRQCNGPTFEETVDMLSIPHDRAQEYLTVRQAAGLELCPTVNRLFPGAKELLLAMKDKADLVIASNGTPEYLSLCLELYGLQDAFAAVMANLPGRTKAQAVAQHLAAAQPDKALMVGDRLGDISAGKANSLPTICVSYGYGDADEWAAADRIAATTAELADMLEEFVG